MSTEDIARRRQAWTRQLRAMGLRPIDAARIAHAEAAQEAAEITAPGQGELELAA